MKKECNLRSNNSRNSSNARNQKSSNSNQRIENK